MTYGLLKRSVGEQRVLEYMRLCDLVIFLGLGSTAAGGFVWHSVRVMGFGFGFIAVGAIVKLAGVIIAYLLMSSRRPTSEIPIWIRRWTRTSSVFGALTALYVVVSHPNVGVQIAAVVVALLCTLLFMRIDAVTRGEWDMATGPSWAEMASPIARLGPAWGWELNIWLTGICLAGAIVLRTAMPSAFEPRIADPNELKIRLFAVVQAERRYYVTHRSYASDVGELQRLGFTAIDSLVSITVEGLGYRAVARDPRGHVSCGVWDGATMELRIEGTRPAEPTCWEDKAQAQ